MEAVVKSNADGPSQVIVTGASGAQFVGSIGDEFFVRSAGENTEAFENAGNLRPTEAVKTVLALVDDANQIRGFQALEMNAGSRGTDTGDDRQFGAGAGVTVHQAVEHASAGGFADGGGNGGDGVIGMQIYIHSLMVNEVSLNGNEQNIERGTKPKKQRRQARRLLGGRRFSASRECAGRRGLDTSTSEKRFPGEQS